jgi:hypothetical protein
MALSKPIAITGRGTVSSLGNDVRTTCAAARAGVVRPSQLDYFRVLSPADGADIPVTGYSATLWTFGFEGESRLLRLLQGALKDLQAQVPDAPWHGKRAGFYLSLPDSNRLDTGIDLFVDEKDRNTRIAKLRETAGDALKPSNRTGLIARAARLSGWPAPCSVRCVKSSGHTGIAECLAEAANELSSGEIEVAIVGGADTLLEEDALNWLKNTARLKTPECPAGLTPGEAGAFLLLETEAAANARGAHIWGILQDLRFADDNRPLLSGRPPLGAGLEQVCFGIAETAKWRDGDPVWFITDQNGECYRAMEWGHALMRLLRMSKAFAQPALWYPAGSFGDTGAVAGALAICLATSAFERGYAPAPSVGLLSSADAGRRAAALIQMPDRIGV